MSFDAKIKELEKLAKELETEKSFDETLKKFEAGVKLIKEALAEMSKQKGKVVEIVKDLDKVLEKEICVE